MLLWLLATQAVKVTSLQTHYHVVKPTVATTANETTDVVFTCTSRLLYLIM